MSNLDGIVERRGHLLFLEWKSPGAPLRTGQRLLLEHLSTRQKVTVYLVEGPTQERKIAMLRVTVYKYGTAAPERLMTLDGLRAEFRRWYEQANRT